MPTGEHLLLIHIGPVQDFIATARKCQDLWFGSWLLSELARSVAESLAHTVPGSGVLIFPGEYKAKDASVANKILARLPPEADPREHAETSRRAMQIDLLERARREFEKVDGALRKRFLHEEVAERQIEDLMEFFWVAVPLENGDYANARAKAETFLAARKYTRNWGPPGWESRAGVPKSSLDGQRESVLDESLYADLSPRETNRDPSLLGARHEFHVKGSERLCGVGLFKRLGVARREGEGGREERSRPAFHSTAHVSSGPLLVRLARIEKDSHPANSALDELLETLRSHGALPEADLEIRCGDHVYAEAENPLAPGQSIRYPRVFSLDVSRKRGLDGSFLFEDQSHELLDVMPQRDTREYRRDTQNSVRPAYRSFFQKIGVPEPFPYYGLLLADGDRMGAAIDKLKSLDSHRKLSQLVETFARECRDLVERRGGSTIYAGGDDVLALVPLHSALACAHEMAEHFRRTVTDYCSQAGIEQPPTLSAGLAIAHYLEDLVEVRELARRAEAMAKRDRNSLAVIYKPRSGGELSVMAEWGLSPNSPDSSLSWPRRIDTWARELDGEEIPDKFAHELERIAGQFESADPREMENLDKVVQSLAARALGRKARQRGAGELTQETTSRLRALLEAGKGTPITRLRSLSAELQIARVFLEAYREAWSPLPVKGGAQ